MPRTLLRILAGVGVELFTLPDGQALADTFADPSVWQDVTSLSPLPAAGWGFDGHAWTAPAAAPAPKVARLLPPLMFRRRFTTAERGAITLAASQGIAKGDATLQVALDDQAAAQVIDLDDPTVAGFLAELVTAGLLTADRPAAILVDPTAAELGAPA